ALAEPAVEQALLQQVDVLVLVDRERPVARTNLRECMAVLLEQPDRLLEQVLEVDEPTLALLRLIKAKDTQHQVERDRRLMATKTVHVCLGREAPVLRPLDLGGEIPGRTELVGRRETVRDAAERQR